MEHFSCHPSRASSFPESALKKITHSSHPTSPALSVQVEGRWEKASRNCRLPIFAWTTFGAKQWLHPCSRFLPRVEQAVILVLQPMWRSIAPPFLWAEVWQQLLFEQMWCVSAYTYIYIYISRRSRVEEVWSNITETLLMRSPSGKWWGLAHLLVVIYLAYKHMGD